MLYGAVVHYVFSYQAVHIKLQKKIKNQISEKLLWLFFSLYDASKPI